jgi:hypothetical protein
VTAAEFRRLALSLPEAEEREHMDHPDFRVGGRIFATLGYPDKSWAMIKLFPDQQQEFVAAHPKMFSPVKGAWGKQGSTNVLLKAATQAHVQAALSAAWHNVAAKARVAAKAQVATKEQAAKKKSAAVKKRQA